MKAILVAIILLSTFTYFSSAASLSGRPLLKTGFAQVIGSFGGEDRVKRTFSMIEDYREGDRFALNIHHLEVNSDLYQHYIPSIAWQVKLVEDSGRLILEVGHSNSDSHWRITLNYIIIAGRLDSEVFFIQHLKLGQGGMTSIQKLMNGMLLTVSKGGEMAGREEGDFEVVVLKRGWQARKVEDESLWLQTRGQIKSYFITNTHVHIQQRSLNIRTYFLSVIIINKALLLTHSYQIAFGQLQNPTASLSAFKRFSVQKCTPALNNFPNCWQLSSQERTLLFIQTPSIESNNPNELAYQDSPEQQPFSLRGRNRLLSQCITPTSCKCDKKFAYATVCFEDSSCKCKILSCQAGYYTAGTLVSSCTKCPTSCLTCALQVGTSAVICTSCPAGFTVISGVCTACPVGCSTCSTVLVNSVVKATCTACLSTLVLQVSGSTSVCGCLTSQYLNTGASPVACVNCVVPCSSCTSPTTCATCVTGYYLSVSSCLTCMPVCKTCLTDSTCATCYSSTFISVGGVCTCPPPLFFDTTTKSCLSCSSIATNCVSCDYSVTYDPANPPSVVCLTAALGYYVDAVSAVVPCISHCSNCSLAPTTMCTTPATNFIYDSATSTCICASTLFFSVTADTCLTCSQAVPGCQANSCVPAAIPNPTLCGLCDSGYYSPAFPTASCTACPTLCSVCSSSTACTTCMNALTVLGDGSCGCLPASNLFLDSATSTCLACSSVIFNCQVCTNATSPVTCTTCVAGSYPSATGVTCYPCPTSCSACSSSSYCTGCEPGYDLVSNQCVCGSACYDCITNSTSGACSSCTYSPFSCSGCLTGYIVSSGNCLLCNATWPQCTECTLSACLACSPPFVLTSSGCRCNNTAGLYLTTDSSTCLSCSSAIAQCTSCSGPSPTACLSCALGYYVSSSQVCSPCTGNCLTCSGTPSNCDSCLVTYTMVSANTCACDTSGGYFYDASTAGCSACSVLIANCLTCTLNATNQTECTSCASAYYWDAGTFTCEACSSVCYNCSSYSVCTSCYFGLIVVAGSCVCDNTSVPAVYLDPASSTCQECSFIITGCSSCTDNSPAITCNACVGSAYLVNNTCVNCPSQCATCNATECLSCPGTLTLINGSCICDSLCTACNTLSVGCLSCSIVSNAITACLACAPGTYLASPNCYSCPSTCATCAGSLNCLTCLPTFILSNGLCSCATTVGMFPNTLGSCESCSSIFYACSQCDIVSGVTACTQCSAGYYLSGTGTCLPCDISCPTCSGTASTCTSCPTGETLSANNTCVCSTASCLACQAVSPHCTQCLYTIYGNFSLCAACEPSYYVNGVNCSPCPSVCKSCGANGACLSCAPTFEVINSTCLCNLAKGMWESNNTCLSCSVLYPNCDTCAQNGSVTLNFSCSQCKFGYYQNNSACVSSACGDGNITSGEACDDSNMLDGDGCSSFCQIQTYFICVGSPSVCTVNANFHIALLGVEVSKTICNRVTISFTLSPFYSSFDGADFKNMLGFVSESQLIYKSCSYSKGVVKYEFDYTGTVAGNAATFTFAPAALMVSETSTLPLIAVSVHLTSTNNILMVYYDEETCNAKAAVGKLTKAIQYASYGTLIASALPCKIVGLELFGVLQLAHINVGNMDNVNTMMTPMMGMKGVHGFTLNLGKESSSSSRLLQSAYTPARVQSIGYESNFLRNCNVMLFLVILVLLVSAILYTLTYCCKACAPSLHSVSKRIIKEVLLTLLLFNCYNFAYSAGIHFNYAPKNDSLYTAGTIAAVLSIVLPILMALGLMCTEDQGFGEYKEKFKPGVVEKLYFVVTIVYRTGIGLYISTMNQDQMSTLIVMALSIAFLLYNLVNLPYTKAYHNYRANICHFTQFVSLFVAMYYRSMMSTTSRSTLSTVFSPAYLQLACIFLSLLVSIIVLSYEIYIFLVECMQRKEKRVRSKTASSQSSIHHQKIINNTHNSEGNIEAIDDNKELQELYGL